MTTIAYKSGLMCADSQITNNGQRFLGIQKVFGTPFTVLGIAGDAHLIEPVLNWFLKAECAVAEAESDPSPLLFAVHLPPDLPDGDVEMLVACRTTRRLYHLDRDGLGIDMGDRAMAALGTGAHYALGAMYAGADAHDALDAALHYDVYSGGAIREVSLDA